MAQHLLCHAVRREREEDEKEWGSEWVNVCVCRWEEASGLPGLDWSGLVWHYRQSGSQKAWRREQAETGATTKLHNQSHTSSSPGTSKPQANRPTWQRGHPKLSKSTSETQHTNKCLDAFYFLWARPGSCMRVWGVGGRVFSLCFHPLILSANQHDWFRKCLGNLRTEKAFAFFCHLFSNLSLLSDC